LSKDTLEMLKRVILYDLIIILLSLVISAMFFKEYTAIIMIGIIIALVNFLLNSVITNYAMKLSGGAILIVVGALARVAIAGAFAVILYNNNMGNIIAYIIGYSLHYISVIAGATTRGHKIKREGK